jgi:copper(I)-binding protein
MRLLMPAVFAVLPVSLLLAACERGAAPSPAPPPPTMSAAEHGAGVHLMQAWLRATPPGATVGAGYGVLHNAGEAPATLVAVESPIAGKVEIHEMREVEGLMQMRRLDEGLRVPAGEQLALAPGGLHLMLMDLRAPLTEGDAVAMTFRFADGEVVELNVPVRRDAAGADEEAHGHH